MASAAWKVDVGSGYATPPQTTTGGATITLKLDSVTGASGGIEWKCTGTHNSTVPVATIQALIDAGLGGTPNGQTCSFTLPAGTGQNYIIQCTVNGGKDANGEDSSALVYTGSVNVLNDAGAIPLAINEDFEVNSTHGVVPRINTALNNLGALTAPVSGTDDNKIAIASSGDLAYSSATLSGSALALGSRNVTTTGNISGTDGTFTGDVTANSFDTSGGGAPSGYAIGLENTSEQAWAGFSSGTVKISVDEDDDFIMTFLSGATRRFDGATGANGRDDRYRVTTASTTPDTSITQGVASGSFSILRATVVSVDQVAPTTNYRAESFDVLAINVGGTITVSSKVAPTVVSAGFGSGWTAAWSDAGSNVARLTLTGSVTNQSWLVIVETLAGSTT